MAWLPVERAVSWSIALHLAIAAAGAYALARRGMRLGRAASLACAVAFSLGGYLGAQAEHLNQLQALAWLPLEVLCLLWIARRDGTPDRRRRNAERAGGCCPWRCSSRCRRWPGTPNRCISAWSPWASQAWRKQRRSGWPRRPALPRARRWTRSLRPLLILAGAAALAAVMAAAQLLPTLELAAESARSGGLSYNEAGSFSWRPWVIARALLPTYGDPLFPEYVAYLGAAGLALAALGALSGIVRQTAPNDDRTPAAQPAQSLSQNPSHVIALTLAIAGFVLALGIVTPLFGILYRVLPGFSLFRAQARWLIVFALGASMLVGLGAQALRDGLTNGQRRAWAVGWLAVVGAMAAGLLAGARISPEPEYQALPAVPVMAGWIAAAIAATALVAVAQAMDTRRMLRVGRRQGSTGAILSGVFVVAAGGRVARGVASAAVCARIRSGSPDRLAPGDRAPGGGETAGVRLPLPGR